MTKTLSRLARASVVSSFCLGLAACVTARPTAPTDLNILRMALTQPVSALQQRANDGEARAQYALAMAYAHGLQHQALDSGLAAQWRRRALAARGYTPITTYVAGLRGKPGRVAIINTPRYDLNVGEALRNDQCAEILARGEPDAAGAEVCGGPEEFRRLKWLWALAKASG